MLWLGAPAMQAVQAKGYILKVCIDPTESMSSLIQALHQHNSEIQTHTTALASPNMAKIQIIC